MKGPFVGENEPRGLAIFDPYCRERACQRSQYHGRSTVGVAKQLKGSDCKRFCERVPIARRHDMKGVMILIPSSRVQGQVRHGHRKRPGTGQTAVRDPGGSRALVQGASGQQGLTVCAGRWAAWRCHAPCGRGAPTSGKFRCFQNCNFRNASQNGYWYPRRANGGGALPAVMTTTVFENRNCDV